MKKMNVAIIAQDSDSTNKKQGEVIPFSANKKEEDYSYTPLPNFLIDEGYLSVLHDTSVTILMVINRHTKGFHKKSKSLSLDCIKDLCGIKDDRTARKFLNQLKEYGLLKVSERKGTTSIYTLTFDQRLPTKKSIAQHAPPTQHAPTPLACHAGTTPYTACTPLKEIYLKENIKEKKKKENWFDLEKIKNHIRDVNNSIDFDEIKNATWFSRELTAFEEYNAGKNHSDYTKQYLFADKLVQVYIKNKSINNQIVSAEQVSDSDKTNTDHHGSMKSENTSLDTKTEKTFSYEPKKADLRNQNTAIRLTLNQIRMFASKLANHAPFASAHAEPGESLKDLENRLAIKLGNPSYAQEIIQDLEAVGYKSKAVGA